MKIHSLHLVSLTLAAALVAPQTSFAAGTLKQAFLSTAGVDATNCGASDNPCRTLQYAIDNAAAAGGVLYLVSPGDYRPATIVTSITIINTSGGAAGVFKTRDDQSTIFIPATAPIAVKLRGLTLDGGGVEITTSFAPGVGKPKLALTDCVIQNAARGLRLRASSGIPIGAYVAGSSFRNVELGVDVSESGEGPVSPLAIDSTTTTSASIAAYRISMFSGHAVVTNSSAIGSRTGLAGGNITNQGYRDAKTVLDRFTATGNGVGASSFGGGLFFSRASIVGNTTGLQLDKTIYGSAPNRTFRNNVVTGNATDIGGSLPTLSPIALQ